MTISTEITRPQQDQIISEYFTYYYTVIMGHQIGNSSENRIILYNFVQDRQDKEKWFQNIYLCDFKRSKWRTYPWWKSFICFIWWNHVSPLHSDVNVVPIYATLTEICYKELGRLCWRVLPLLPSVRHKSHIANLGHLQDAK